MRAHHRQRGGKLILLLFAVVFIVLFVMMSIGSDDVNIQEEHQQEDGEYSPKDPIENAISFVHCFNLASGIIDASHKYKSHIFSIVGSEWSALSQQGHICLATHSSLDHMHWLANTAAMWTRSVSVAVFTPDVEFHLTVAFIAHLHKCHPDVARKVSFHFVYPLDRPAKMSQLDIPAEVISDCTRNVTHVLEDLLLWRPPAMMREWRDELMYPQNLLRNIARKTCPTEFVVSPDVDMLPTPTLADTLETFLANNSGDQCLQCAFVLPIYEIHKSVSSLPTDKTQLLELVSNKLARPYHIEVFSKNQDNSNLSVWEKQVESPTLDVAYEVANYSFWYEPVYVTRGENPPFDERFVGYGNTRNTQVYEMFVQGWKFLVLNNAFLVHWGFQDTSSYSPARLLQATENRRLLLDFLRDMALRYDGDPLNLLDQFPKNNTIMLLKNDSRKRR